MLSIFELKDVNRCAYAETVEKFPNFCAGVLQVPKTTENGYFRRGDCDRGTAQMVQFRAMGIISGTSRHPKDVREFWWGRTVLAL